MLYKLQMDFMKGIYNREDAAKACSLIQQKKELSAEQIFSIYRGSIYAGLKKALAETYPVTNDLVGEDFFNAMLGQYITEYPCRVQDLNDYGEELAGFVQGLPQARSVPYLADLARLEWFYNIATNVAIQQNNLSELSLLTEEQYSQIKLALPNGSCLLSSCYPVDDIWNLQQDDNEIHIKEENVFLLIWKNDFLVRVERLTEENFYFLKCISEKMIFSDVCTAVLENNANANISSLLSEAVKKGWLQSYTL